ncbi:MAG TPA: peptide-methionine (S)-S-oxide reductase MsrA [Mariprofundaceae bacterium]|nr:peptide-methionine (S)-S-oxide reductase MsrA [Mariprofundaceae bacterium]
MIASRSPEARQAVFAGGCFWCMQPPFDQAPGVLATEVGYSGGNVPSPTYEQVCRGDTGHLEVIRVTYDPGQISYAELLEIFWRNIDPTQSDGQFADRGPQYRTAIFVSNAEERRLAESSKASLQASGKFAAPLATEIRDSAPFYPAEDDHQHYYRKNTLHYQLYKKGSGRAGFIERYWGGDEH